MARRAIKIAVDLGLINVNMQGNNLEVMNLLKCLNNNPLPIEHMIDEIELILNDN